MSLKYTLSIESINEKPIDKSSRSNTSKGRIKIVAVGTSWKITAKIKKTINSKDIIMKAARQELTTTISLLK